jgi:hypothetical protein
MPKFAIIKAFKANVLRFVQIVVNEFKNKYVKISNHQLFEANVLQLGVK